jgi:hypothetical protein
MNVSEDRSQPLEGSATNSPGRADAGAVLRRTPPPGQAPSGAGNPAPDGAAKPRLNGISAWRVAPRRTPPIVDNGDKPQRPPAAATPPQAGTPRPGSIVDTKDTVPTSAANRPRPLGLGPRPADRHIVDNRDNRSGAGQGNPYGNDETLPAVTKFMGAETYRANGRNGPDDQKVKAVRAARKQKLADRARALGRDPGANSTPSVAGRTRSEKTHQGYIERGQQLLKRYRKQAGLSTSNILTIDPVHFVNWLFSIKPTVTADAWRPYRQAAKAVLATIPHDDTEKAIAMIDADITEAAETSTKEPPAAALIMADGRAKLPRRTSALKEKRFPKRDFDQVISYLKYFSKSKHAETLADWMIAGVATGLRPIEWQATDLEIKDDPESTFGRHVWLYVVNAKATNGRGNGAHRTIDLSGCRDETIAAVKRMSEAGMQWLIDGEYDQMQSQCSQLLYTVSNKLFRKRQKVYALYSLRHQFVANAKTYHDPASISAMCGHIVTDTAITSYGKKRSGWDPEDILDRAAPVAEEIATVRQQHKFFEDRLKLQQAAGILKPGMLPEDDDFE